MICRELETELEENHRKSKAMVQKSTHPHRGPKKEKKGHHSSSSKSQWDTLPFDMWTFIINMLAGEMYDPVGICALRMTCRTMRNWVNQNPRAREVCKIYERLNVSVWKPIRPPLAAEEYKLTISNVKPVSAPGSANSSCTWVALMLPACIKYKMVLPDFAGFVKSAVVHDGVLYTLAVLYERERQGLNLITFCFKNGTCHRLWPKSLIPPGAKRLGVTQAGDVVITCRDGQTWHCVPQEL